METKRNSTKRSGSRENKPAGHDDPGNPIPHKVVHVNNGRPAEPKMAAGPIHVSQNLSHLSTPDVTIHTGDETAGYQNPLEQIYIPGLHMVSCKLVLVSIQGYYSRNVFIAVAYIYVLYCVHMHVSMCIGKTCVLLLSILQQVVLLKKFRKIQDSKTYPIGRQDQILGNIK